MSGGPPGKVQVKVRGPPSQGLEDSPPVKVQVKVQGGPLLGQGPSLGPPSSQGPGSPLPGQGPGLGEGVPPGQGPGLGGPWSRFRSRSGGAPRPGQGLGGPRSKSESRSGPPPVKVQKCEERRRYASCGHAGGLSCFIMNFPPVLYCYFQSRNSITDSHKFYFITLNMKSKHYKLLWEVMCEANLLVHPFKLYSQKQQQSIRQWSLFADTQHI